MKALLRGPLVSLASQGIGLVQLGILIVVVGADRYTDAYLYLFSMGLVPILILLVGLMYPLLLNDHRISKVGLRRLSWLTPLVSVGFVIGGTWWLAEQGKFSADMVPLVALLIGNSVFQATAWFRAVAAEADGTQLWISGIALPANVLGTILLVIPWGSSILSVTAMSLGLLIGNLVITVVMVRRRVGQDALDSAPLLGSGRAGSYWFFGKATVGYSSQIAMQSAAVILPSSSLTILNIVNKIVGSASASFVNALMPRFVHQQSESTDAGRRFLRFVAPSFGACGIVLFGIAVVFMPEAAGAALILALWLVLAPSAAIAQRLAFRFLPPSASRVSVFVVVLVVVLALLSTGSTNFSLIVLLAALALLDGLTAMLLLWLLKDRVMSIVAGVLSAGLIGIWAFTLVA